MWDADGRVYVDEDVADNPNGLYFDVIDFIQFDEKLLFLVGDVAKEGEMELFVLILPTN